MTRSRTGRSRPPDELVYKSEAHLCEHLAIVAREQNFEVHPETSGWDLLLVAGENCCGFEKGDQVGVQAKLRANFQVLIQAWTPEGPADLQQRPGPHYYAVLVPRANDGFIDIARRFQITVLEGQYIDRQPLSFKRWYRFEHKALCWVPTVEILAVAGGVASPRSITPWKLGAINLCLTCVERGYITKADFVENNISMSKWHQLGWIFRSEVVRVDGKKEYRYQLRLENQPPLVRYPEIAAALQAERARKRTPEPVATAEEVADGLR